MRESGGQGPVVWPNSETGDIPASKGPEEQRPTVKRVVGMRALPPGLRRDLTKKIRNRAETVQKRQETPVLRGERTRSGPP